MTKNQPAAVAVDARPMPRVLWMAFGIDDDGKEHQDFPIRIVETAPHHLVVETSYKDSMGCASWKALSMEQNWVLRALVYRVAGEHHNTLREYFEASRRDPCFVCLEWNGMDCALHQSAPQNGACCVFTSRKPGEGPCHDCRFSHHDGISLICSHRLNMLTASCSNFRNKDAPPKKIPCPRCRHAMQTAKGLVCGVYMLRRCDRTLMVEGPSGDLFCRLQFIERVLGPGCEERCRTCFYKTAKHDRNACSLVDSNLHFDDITDEVLCSRYSKHEET